MLLLDRFGMKSLTQNIEGLRSHSMLLSIFDPNSGITDAQRKWRAWLIHCLMKTSRHYNEARQLVLAQIDESRRPPEEIRRGRQLPLLDFSLEMEDCITSLDKVVLCIQQLAKANEIPGERVLKLEKEARLLRAFRNKQEHMHLLVASGQAGNGPILVSLTEQGSSIGLLKLTMNFSTLYALIDAAYVDISSLFPNHDCSSPPKPAGPIQISMTATISVIPSNQEIG